MFIKIEVPDGTKRVIVAHLLPNLLWHQEVYSADKLQGMTVSDEPCKWCSIESEIEPSCIECVQDYDSCVLDCNDYSKFKPMKHYCGYCGRDLRKDVN